MRITKTSKVHMAGTPDKLVQRCSRCHSALIDNRRRREGYEYSYWKIGQEIHQDRSGASRIETAADRVGIRDCGRRK